MKVESVVFNDPPGEFRVLRPDGDVAFDSRLPSQRIHLRGVTDVVGRNTSPAPGGGVILNPSAYVTVPFGKTFPRAPYVRSASRRFYPPNLTEQKAVNRIYPPYIRYSDAGTNFLTYIHGHFSNAGTTQLYLGNLDSTDPTNPAAWNGSRRVWYAIFDNPIGA